MTNARTVWGIHLEWDDSTLSSAEKDVAIGWSAMDDLDPLPASRDAFKAAYAKAYPSEKPGAVPVKAGVLYRFAKEILVGDVVIYPSKADKLVNIGIIKGEYRYLPSVSAEYPHRRKVEWKAHPPRAQFSQQALYEIGSAITLFQVTNNAEEFLAALEGQPFEAADVDASSAVATAVQAEESAEDFVIKRLKNNLTPQQFEHFVAELLRCMGYHARVTSYSRDGGVDIIAHKDQLGFEPPIIKVQCKQTLQTVSSPTVQQLLGAIQSNEHALFITLGSFTPDAMLIERGKSNLRLIGGTDLVQLIFDNYERFEPRLRS